MGNIQAVARRVPPEALRNGIMYIRMIQEEKHEELFTAKNTIKPSQQTIGMLKWGNGEEQEDSNSDPRFLTCLEGNVLFALLRMRGFWRLTIYMAKVVKRLKVFETKAGILILKWSWNQSRSKKENIDCCARIAIDWKLGKNFTTPNCRNYTELPLNKIKCIKNK